MNLNNQILSDITVHMKYAKHINEANRRENWYELVTRNKEMHLKKFPELSEQINYYYQLVYDKKVLPSMRGLQFGGKAIEVNESRQYNCSFLHMDHYKAFSEVMFLLLSGCGVGYSVQFKHIANLPEIKKPTKDRKYVIDDSIQGWADAVNILIKSYYLGVSKPRFDFSQIRPKGALLITSGGKAPGPDPLKECLFQIEKILDSKQNGEKLSSVEIHDINCHIADAVLSGGIRRAAMIALFSFDDEDMLTCKFGNWWELNPQRGRANNSAVIVRHRVKKEDFFKLWSKIKESGSGEPGFFFTNNADWGLNPCAEISLRSCQFCVSGDTKLITRLGIDTISNLVGKEIEIWNGEEWSKVKPYQTGTEDSLYRVYFSDGSYLDATENHKFLVKKDYEKTFKEVETIDLIHLLNTYKRNIQVPRFEIKLEQAGINIEAAYEYGFFTGDGFIDGKQLYASLYNEDKNLGLRGEKYQRTYVNWNGNQYEKIKFNQLNFQLGIQLKTKEGLPNEVFTWNATSILNFIAGWVDADGSKANKGCRLYGSEKKIRDAQLLLTKVGIISSVNLMQNSGIKTNLGTRKNAVWYLQIPNASKIPSRRLSLSEGKNSPFKGKNQIIKKIEKLEGKHNSYCLTEDKLHQCVFNNVLTKQCNLTTINAGDIESQEDFNQRAEAAAFIGTLQASYTDFFYLRDIWRTVTEKEALLGVSMTGIASGKVFQFNTEEAAEKAVNINRQYAEVIGINPAARVTTVKPEGTSSLVLGTSSGVHDWHDDYFIRRIRVGKNESIYTYLSIYHPELIEDDFFKPTIQAVISVPLKAPENALTRTNTSAIDLLQRVKELHKSWIQPGHISGENTNNVSATITIKPHEWEEVGDWLWNNKYSYTALSFLPYSDHTYKQAPFETCDKETYEKLSAFLTEINLDKVVELEDKTTLADNLACFGGACEL